MRIYNRTVNNKKPNLSLQPDFIATSVAEIDFGYLKQIGIKACFIDLDGTVVDRGTFEVTPNITDSLKNSGMHIYIATNRPKSRSLRQLKEQLHADGVLHPLGLRGKPTKTYYSQGLAQLGLKPNEVVMIGDRLLQDIWGANYAGLYSLAVFKLGLNKGFLDRLLSHFERKKLEKLYKQYKSSN